MTFASSPLIPVVFDLLRQQRSVVTYPVHELSTIINRLAFLEQSVLIELVSLQHTPGYLLVQRGWLVFAQHGRRTGPAALDAFQHWPQDGTIRLFALHPAAAALSCAVIGGRPDDHDAQANASLDARLTDLMRRGFSGVVATGTRTGLRIWQLRSGQLGQPQDVITGTAHEFFVQLAWMERRLSPLHWSSVDALDEEPGRRSDEAASESGPSLQDEALAWQAFHWLLQAHLGEAATRVYTLVRHQYGAHHGSALGDALTSQIDRVAGPAAALEFRRDHLS